MNAPAKLTPEEIAALDAAQAVLAAHTPDGANWSLSFYPGDYGFSTSCYFDSTKSQHMLWNHPSLAGVVAAGIAHEALVPNDLEAKKAIRVERLQKELAALTGATA